MQDHRMSPMIKGLLAGIGFGLVCLLCFYMGTRYSSAHQVDSSVLDDPLTTDKIQYLEKLIDDNYLYDVRDSDLSEGLYAGLVYGLGDPYSTYYTAEDFQAEMEMDEGSYVGLGIVFHKHEDGQGIIDEVYAGSPAESAGLQAEDEIWEVNGEDVVPMASEEIVKNIRGSEEATLLIKRPSTREELTVTIHLEAVELISAESQMLDDGIGYLRITQFTNQTPGQFEACLASLREEGMERLIVDLRGNPGGGLLSVCDVLRQILPEGLIVYMEDKYGRQDTYSCDGTKELDVPLAVLINGGSASAAEIFAGAVQDYGLGTIVGTKSYGKGVVQSLISLVDGSAVKLTTAQYFTPKGNVIQNKGVIPDVAVSVDPSDDADAFPDKDTQLAKAIEAVKMETPSGKGEEEPGEALTNEEGQTELTSEEGQKESEQEKEIQAPKKKKKKKKKSTETAEPTETTETGESAEDSETSE